MKDIVVSTRNRITLPREARVALGITAGAKLQLVVRSNTMILMRVPPSYSHALANLASGVYPADYIDAEHDSW